jgi:FkbM family methyltransferase
MTDHYKIFGLDVNIDNPKLLNYDLKTRLTRQTWEYEEINSLDHIAEDACVLEVGACIGVVSSVLNKRLKVKNNQVSVEANPYLIEQLTRTKNDNRCQFHIVNAFIDTDINTQTFSIHPNHIMGGRLGTHANYETVKIESITIEALSEKYNLQFNTLIMDIENGEYALWNKNFFTDQYIGGIKTIIIELHSNTNRNKMREHLKTMFEEIIINSANNMIGIYKR